MHGCNIVDNGRYAFYAYVCGNPETVIDAENNWWGVADSASIEEMVYHHTDEAKCPIVDYIPFAAEAFQFDDPTGIFEPPEDNIPSEFTLLQNYPNPFNASTMIQFSLSEPGEVDIDVYDILGRKVRQLAAGHYSAGAHIIPFDGKDSHNKPLSSGIYLYRITAGQQNQTKKMVLLK